GVLGLDETLRNDEGDVVAGPAHTVLDKRGIGRPEARPVAAVQSTRDGQVAPSGGLPVRPGEHRGHAWRRPRPARVDRADACMGMRRAEHVAESHAWQHDIADIAAAAPKQARVLEPGDALADREFTHLISSESRRRWHFYRKAAPGWLPGPRPGADDRPGPGSAVDRIAEGGMAAAWPLDFVCAMSAQIDADHFVNQKGDCRSVHRYVVGVFGDCARA